MNLFYAAEPQYSCGDIRDTGVRGKLSPVMPRAKAAGAFRLLAITDEVIE